MASSNLSHGNNKAAPKGPKVNSVQSSLLDRVKKARKAASVGGGGSRNFYRLEKGKNVFRVLADPECPVPFLPILLRTRGMKQSFRTTMDLGYLLQEEEHTDYMRAQLIALGYPMQETVDKFAEFGDPVRTMQQKLFDMNEGDLVKNTRMTKPATLINVWTEKAGIKLFECANSRFDAIMALYAFFPEEGSDEEPEVLAGDLFDLASGPSIMVRGTGDGFSGENKRAYDAPILYKPFDSNVKASDLIDLPKEVKARTLPYDDFVRFLFEGHRNLFDVAELSMSDFGVSEASK